MNAVGLSAVSAVRPPFEMKGDSRRVDVHWRGEWDEPIAAAYADGLAAYLRVLREKSGAATRPSLVVDATELVRCNILARGCLADLQTSLRPKLGRAAFIASSPRMRGLCLWIVKVSDDATARVFGNRDGVQEWLEGTQTRLEAAQGVAREWGRSES